MPRDNPHQDCRDNTVPTHVLKAIAQHMEFANFTLAQILQTQNDIDSRLSAIEEDVKIGLDVVVKARQLKSLIESNTERLKTILNRSI